MARQAVVNAVEAYLAANWTRCPIVGMVRKDDISDPSASFLAVQYPVANTIRPTVSDRYYQEEGGIRLVLQMTRDESPAVMMQWADDLADLFRDQNIGGVKFRHPTSPFIDDTNDEGNYFSLSIVVDYTFDYRG